MICINIIKYRCEKQNSNCQHESKNSMGWKTDWEIGKGKISIPQPHGDIEMLEKINM